MGEESDRRDEMSHQSRKLDIGGAAVNVEELLRMLEAAVEKEFVVMKTTCEGLGGNSDYTQHSKDDETNSGLSPGTPNSLYSACSASGSTFSRCSYGKEKKLPCVETSQDEEQTCIADETREAGWVERHEAFQLRIRSKLEATSWEERMEATLDGVNDSQRHDVSKDAVSGSRALRSEDLVNNGNTNVSTPEEILGNFQCMLQEMETDANHLPNQSNAESCILEVQGVPADGICTSDLSIRSNSPMQNVVAAAWSPWDSPLASTIVLDSNSATKRVELLAQRVVENSSKPPDKIVDGDDLANLRDGPIRPIELGENKIEGSVCGTKGINSDLDQADGPDTAFDASIERVEGVVFAMQDIYKEFANHARSSLIEAIQTLDCKSPEISNVRGDNGGGGLSHASIDHGKDDASLRGSEQSSRSTIHRDREQSGMERCNSLIKLQDHGLLPEGHKLSAGQTGDGSGEPCANCWKDREVLKIKQKVQWKKNTVQVNLRKVNTRKKISAVLITPEDSVNQFVASHHVGVRQSKSTPRVLHGVLEEVLFETTDRGASERSITAHDYFQQYGWDDDKLRSASVLSHTGKENHCFLRPEVEVGSKKESVNLDEVAKRADQTKEASEWLSEYHTGLQRYVFSDVDMKIAEEPTDSPDRRITSATDREQVYRGYSPMGGNAFNDNRNLAYDDVVEHAVGFGSNCCTPSRRGRELGVQCTPCCNDRTLEDRDPSEPLHSIHESKSIFSTTFLEMEKAASSCVLGINSKQFADWNKVDYRRSGDSCNESTQSTLSETFFDRLLSYGRSVKKSRNTRCTPVSGAPSENSVPFKSAGEVTGRSNSECPTHAHVGGWNHREKMKVVVRMRPFAEHEKMCPLRQILCLPEDKVIVKQNNPELLKQSCIRSKESQDAGFWEYTVDKVVDDSYLQTHRWDKKAESQKRMYELIGLPCLEYALDGYNTTIIAYGQVGSGKTFTMMGDDTEGGRGIMPRLAEELMNQINTKFRNEFMVQVSYLEIYQERIRDLLVPSKMDSQPARAEWQGSVDSGASRCGSVNSDRRWWDSVADNICEESMDGDTASYLSFGAGTFTSSRRAPSVCFDCPSAKKEFLKIREHPVSGPYVEGLLWKDVYAWDDMEQVLLEGAARRTLGANPSNRFSNRGHTMFTIRLFKEHEHVGRSSNVRVINLVDLAGTEKPNLAKRISLERLDESRYINRSIAHLNDVILNLSKNSKFVSYRNSCLTKLLRDSLGGNYKTFLIAHLSPAEQDFQESVTTLRYAARASHIQSAISSHPEKKERLTGDTKKEVLHNLVQNLARKIKDEGRHQEVQNLESNFPIFSSFKIPRVEIPENSLHGHWI